MSGIYADFMSNNKVELDPEFARKAKEMNDYYNAIVDEVHRIEGMVNCLKVREAEYLDIVSKTQAKQAELGTLVSDQEATLLKIESAVAILGEYDARIAEKEKQLADYTDLSHHIATLSEQKEEILLFNEQNAVNKDEIRLLTEQTNLLRQHCLELETKKTRLQKEIIEKEHQSRLLDRDLELPEKKLQEAKQLNDSAQSTFKAIEEIKKQDAKQTGTIGWYIAKLQKKYPGLDFLNVV